MAKAKIKKARAPKGFGNPKALARKGASVSAIRRDFERMSKSKAKSAKGLQKATIGSHTGRGWNTRGAHNTGAHDS